LQMTDPRLREGDVNWRGDDMDLVITAEAVILVWETLACARVTVEREGDGGA